MIKFHKINEIYEAGNNTRFSHTFEDLVNLNHILKSKLPNHLIQRCHVGAIDIEKSIIVIFVDDSQVLHIIKIMSNILLQGFYSANYPFNNLLVKVGIRDRAAILRPHRIDSKLKGKLSELAIAIGKPEIIIDRDEDEADENEINF